MVRDSFLTGDAKSKVVKGTYNIRQGTPSLWWLMPLTTLVCTTRLKQVYGDRATEFNGRLCYI